MSGYSSKAEAVDVLRASIAYNAGNIGLPTDPRAFNVSAIVQELVYSRGPGYGWGIDPNEAAFHDSLLRNLRKARSL